MVLRSGYTGINIWSFDPDIQAEHLAGPSDEPVGAGVPGPGEPGGAVPGRHQLQLRRARQEVPAHVQSVWRGEDRRRARPALRYTQVLVIQHGIGNFTSY